MGKGKKNDRYRVFPLPTLDHDPDETEDFRPRHKGPLTRHHMVPKSRKGKTTLENIVLVPDRVHAALHQVFGPALPEEIVLSTIIDLAPVGYFDCVVLIHNGRKICLTAKDIRRRQVEPRARVRIPSFEDSSAFRWSKPVYLRRRKRNRPNFSLIRGRASA